MRRGSGRPRGRPAGDRDDDLPGLLQGAAALELRHWDAALGHLDEALRRRPGTSTLLHYKGLALAGKGNREGAAAAFREALDLAPKGWGLGAETRRLLEEGTRR